MNTEERDAVEEVEEEIRTKIVHLLKIYPVVSPTMLQSGLGPSLRPAIWRPVLRSMIADSTILEESISKETPAGRYNDYKMLRLPGTTVHVE